MHFWAKTHACCCLRYDHICTQHVRCTCWRFGVMHQDVCSSLALPQVHLVHFLQDSRFLCPSLSVYDSTALFLHQFVATKTTENVSLVYHSLLYSSNPAAGCKTRTSYLVVVSWRRATQEVDRQVLSGCKISAFSALLTPTIHTVIPMR